MSAQSDLIAECTTVAQGGMTWISDGVSGTTIPATTSQHRRLLIVRPFFDVCHGLAHRITVCKNAWNHDSFAEIVWLIGEISALLLSTSSLIGI
jgi:hypothetical protein